MAAVGLPYAFIIFESKTSREVLREKRGTGAASCCDGSLMGLPQPEGSDWQSIERYLDLALNRLLSNSRI